MRIDLAQHPLRQRLNDEVHARPPLSLEAPALVSFITVLHAPDNGVNERSHLADLCARLGQALAPQAEAAHLIVSSPDFRLKWERHGEFSTYTFFSTPKQAHPAPETALHSVPIDWLQGIPGEVLAAGHIEVCALGSIQLDSWLAQNSAPHETQVISRVAGQAGWLRTDFRIRDGFTQFTLIDENMSHLRTGRVVQRIIEVETYRMMSLLAFPTAKQVGQRIHTAEAELATLIDRMASAQNAQDERAVLQDLTHLAAEIEHSLASTNFRFGAAAAYYRLTMQRIASLKETRVSGHPTVKAFMERRLAPALDTCASVARRQEELAARIAQTSQLLRTRVDLELERQNQALLAQMNRRAELQLRLQETVEGLSVVVLTYYGSQLVNYLSKGLKDWLPWTPETLTAASIPALALLIAWGTRRMRKKLAQHPSSGPM